MAIKSGETTYHQAKRGIVQNGLVFNLDAGVDASYDGGTTWRDLEGGNNGTLTNGPTFDRDDGGSIVFDATNEYVLSDVDFSINPSNGITMGIWVKGSSATNNTLISYSKPLTNNGCRLQLYQSKVNFVYGGVASYSFNYSAATFFNNTWRHLFVSSDGSNALMYLNGSYFNSVSLGTPSTSDLSRVLISQYTHQAGSGFGGSCSAAYIYNRALTASEVLQNYNVTRHRFGV